ncbi:hypothetical protein HDV00_008609 [Rhizophlyctis rosea]|nr:hypothetical protein HDV00_008609 [Rhizophlyctis rosea]
MTPPPDVAVLYLHGLSPPSHVPERNSTVSKGLTKAIARHAPGRIIAYACVDLACLLTERQAALRDAVKSFEKRSGIWDRLGSWVKETVTETLLNQAMSFHANGMHRHLVFCAICDALKTLAIKCGTENTDADPPPLIIMAYSMGSSTATEFLAEFFYHWFKKERKDETASHFDVYARRMGSAALKLLLNVRTFYTIGSPIYWHFPHRPVTRRLPTTIQWINMYYPTDVIAHPLHNRGYGTHITDLVLPIHPSLNFPSCVLRPSWWKECIWSAVKLTPASHVCYIDNEEMYRHIAVKVEELAGGGRGVRHVMEEGGEGEGCVEEGTGKGRGGNIWGYVPSPIYLNTADKLQKEAVKVRFENLEEFTASVDDPDTDYAVFLYFHGPTSGTLQKSETQIALSNARLQTHHLNSTSPRKLSVLYVTTDFTSSSLSTSPPSSPPNDSLYARLQATWDFLHRWASYDALREYVINIAGVVMACLTEDVITVSMMEGFDKVLESIAGELSEVGFGKESGRVAKLVVVGNSLGGALATMYFGNLHHSTQTHTPQDSAISLSRNLQQNTHLLPRRVEQMGCMELHSFITLGSHLLWCLDLESVRWPNFVGKEGERKGGEVECGKIGVMMGGGVVVERVDSGVGEMLDRSRGGGGSGSRSPSPDEETSSLGDSACDLGYGSNDDSSSDTSTPLTPSPSTHSSSSPPTTTTSPRWLSITYQSDAFSHPLHPLFSTATVQEISLPGMSTPSLREALWFNLKRRNVVGACGAVVENVVTSVSSMFAAISLAYIKDDAVWERVGERLRDIIQHE